MENLLDSANLVCIAEARTKAALVLKQNSKKLNRGIPSALFEAYRTLAKVFGILPGSF